MSVLDCSVKRAAVTKLLDRIKEAERLITSLSGELESYRIKKAERLIKSLSGELESLRDSVLSLKKDGLPLDEFSESSSPDGGKIKPNEDQSDGIPTKRCCFDFNREGDYVVAYTDGACENNGKENAKAGIGVWFGPNHPLNISRPVKGKPTNHRAEIQACIAALATANDNGVKKVIIRTDFEFIVNCMISWIIKWKKNNWKRWTGEPVKNKEELLELDIHCGYMEDIKWEYVAGHKGDIGNWEADKLAREGAVMYRNK